MLEDSEHKIAEMAKRKLAQIIEREGDLDGERRKPYYLEQLIEEIKRANQFSELCYLIHQRKKKCPQPKPQGKSQSTTLLYHNF